jgi:uncharacterized membrane protein
VGRGQLGHALGTHWGSFAAYVISFAGIGIAWMHHNAIFDQVVELDRPIMLLNLLVLMSIAFLPFPTSLLGQYIDRSDDATTAAVTYSGAWTLAAVAIASLWTYASRQPGILSREVDRAAARRLRRLLWGAALAYIGFTLVALASPVATVVLYFVSAAGYLWRSDYRALSVAPGAPDDARD